MKNFKLFVATLLVALTAGFAACKTNEPTQSGPGKPGTDPTPDPTPSSTHSIEGLQVVTCKEALDIAQALDTAKSTDVCYVCEAPVSIVNTAAADVPSKYNNVNFKIKDATGEISCQYTYYLDSVAFTSADQIPAVGDTVKVVGKLKKYLNKNTNVCYLQFTNAYIYSVKKAGGSNVTPGATMTVAEALAAQGTSGVKVNGYIVAALAYGVNKSTPDSISHFEFSNFTGYNALFIADSKDEKDPTKMLCIKMNDSGYDSAKSRCNLKDNPGNLGKAVSFTGDLKAVYTGLPGMRNVAAFELEGYDPNAEVVEPTATVVTVAEFIAAAESNDVYYELTGTIVDGTADGHKFDLTTYGNFDLQDAAGNKVYIYGLNSTYTGTLSSDKTCGKLGLAAGDNITIRGVRGSYNGTIEMKGGYFVKKN